MLSTEAEVMWVICHSTGTIRGTTAAKETNTRRRKTLAVFKSALFSLAAAYEFSGVGHPSWNSLHNEQSVSKIAESCCH